MLLRGKMENHVEEVGEGEDKSVEQLGMEMDMLQVGRHVQQAVLLLPLLWWVGLGAWV